MPRIDELLRPDRIAFLDGDRDGAIAALCRLATRNAWQREALEKAVRARESMSTTALDCGVAVPHGHVPELDRFVLAVGICPEGLEWFGQPHGKPVRVVVLIGAPEGKQAGYLRLLSSIVKLFDIPEVREHLIGCSDPEEAVRVLIEDAARVPPSGMYRAHR